MRRGLIFALLAATAALPATAMAQDAEIAIKAETGREQIREGREQRQQARQERQEQRARAAAEAGMQPVVVQRDRRERREERRRGGAGPVHIDNPWLGDPNDPRMEAHRRRYERLDRRNARRHGTPEQLRDLVEQQRAQAQARREQRRDDRSSWRDDRRDWREDRRETRRDWREDRRESRRDWREDRRDAWRDRRAWDRGWRTDRRYDWRSYRDRNRYIYRAPRYYAPYSSYRYNRFSIGQLLDRPFWGRNYWIHDPWQYRLPYAPQGYVWVRYYDDVLLVDTWSGRVVDVIHSFFW